MKIRKTVKLASILAVSLALTACKSVDERAEERYQSGLALLEAGDPDRAIVELRNVFELDGTHQEARRTLAQIFLDQGRMRQSYSQLLRIAEQYPEDLRTRLELSNLAFQLRNWDEVERHGSAAQEIAPDDPEVAFINIGRAYRDAVQADDTEQQIAVAQQATESVADFPGSIILRSVLIDRNSREGDFDAALVNLDYLIELTPASKALQEQRLAIVAQQNDPKGIEEQLMAMVNLFPDDIEIKGTMLRFFLANERVDDAENFLRSISDPSDEDPAPFLDLIRFIAETRGDDAALVEIERAITLNPNPAPFRALRASLTFAKGNEAAAIAELEKVIEEGAPSDELNGIKVTLARMLLTQDNEVGTRRLLEEVLEENSRYAPALKMRASLQIDADEVEFAITDLRAAIDAEPDDSEALTLMSQAYARLGSHDLSLEYLALAVEASNNAPAESIRYAARLLDDEQFIPAENVLLPALRLSPGNVDILEVLGRIYTAMEDTPRAQQVIDTLRRVGTDQAIAIANATEAELVNQTQGAEQALDFLEQLANSDDNDLNARLFLLRGRIASGDIEGAQGLLATMLEDQPSNVALRSVQATLMAVAGDYDEAEAAFRRVIVEEPGVARNWVELTRLLLFQDKRAQADDLIDDGLVANPQNADLLWIRASLLEADQDIDGAIEIYESLYESTSGAPVVANNLASLLATYRDDEESLERAYVVARRLRGTEVPQFQDTIGWILFRRGDHGEALPYLESAAAALENDPIVQYHLGMAQLALGETTNGTEQLEKAIELAGPDDNRRQFEMAREELEKLRNPQE